MSADILPFVFEFGRLVLAAVQGVVLIFSLMAQFSLTQNARAVYLSCIAETLLNQRLAKLVLAVYNLGAT